MGFKSDIEIAQECTMEPITKIAEKAGIDDKYLPVKAAAMNIPVLFPE